MKGHSAGTASVWESLGAGALVGLGVCVPAVSVSEALLGCASLLGVLSSPEECNRLLVILGCWVSAGEADVEGRLAQSGPFAQGGPLDVLSFIVWDIDTDSVGSHVCLLVTHGVLVMFLVAEVDRL